LYNQLLYYRSLFDLEKALASTRGTGRSEEVRALATANTKSFAEILAVVERYLERNGRRYVDMKGLFAFMERMQV
jgi:DNA polymerase alpha subunit A